MKTNFDITIPSIPGKTIKFKIQDIKSSAFSTQRPRFYDNKSFLTQKFIDSFNNFHAKKTQQHQLDEKMQEETQSGSRINQWRQTNLRWRDMIPEDKKYLIVEFEKRKNEGIKEEKPQRGKSFTFHRQPRKLHEEEQSQEDVTQENLVIDNGIFSIYPRNSVPSVSESVKRPLPSCVFKIQTRKRFYQKLQNQNQVPGPGKYTANMSFNLNQGKGEQVKSKEDQMRSKHNQKRRALSQTSHSEMDYKKLKSIITNIVIDEKKEINRQANSDDAFKSKQNPHLPSYNFVLDDRDRFGKQKYPIAWRSNVPGPGSYEEKRAIEENARKVAIVEEQRRLLKQWFHQ